MPVHIKTMVSLVACITALVFAYLEYGSGRLDTAWVAALTGLFAVIAMWIFPEAMKKKIS